MKEQIIDITSAIKEEAVTSIVESDSFRTAVISLAGLITSTEVSTLAGSILGAAAPRINGIFLTYKQNRFERNLTQMVEAISERIELLERNYLNLNVDMREKYRSIYVEMLLDNIVDERQKEKIDWNVNGFIANMDNSSNDNIMQIFFDTLAELTVLDVDVLKMYDTFSDTDLQDVQLKYGVNYDQMKLVKEKLVRLGLLNRKNDEVRDTNIDQIVEYLQKVEKDNSKRNPQGVKLPNKIKKIGHTESYKLSSLGRNFLIAIGETAL